MSPCNISCFFLVSYISVLSKKKHSFSHLRSIPLLRRFSPSASLAILSANKLPPPPPHETLEIKAAAELPLIETIPPIIANATPHKCNMRQQHNKIRNFSLLTDAFSKVYFPVITSSNTILHALGLFSANGPIPVLPIRARILCTLPYPALLLYYLPIR